MKVGLVKNRMFIKKRLNTVQLGTGSYLRYRTKVADLPAEVSRVSDLEPRAFSPTTVHCAIKHNLL
jgi:hypothetical protein